MILELRIEDLEVRWMETLTVTDMKKIDMLLDDIWPANADGRS